MSRARILADTLARLEAERYTPLPERPEPDLLAWTPEEQAEHRRVLAAAIGVNVDDAVMREDETDAYTGDWQMVRGVLRPVRRAS